MSSSTDAEGRLQGQLSGSARQPSGPATQTGGRRSQPGLAPASSLVPEGRGHEKASPDECDQATQTSSLLSRTQPSV